MTKEEIFERITLWEKDAGESFTDYFNAELNAPSYMFWCLGRGYISKEQFNLWEEAYRMNELEAEDPNYFVYNEWNDEKAQFAVVISEEWNEEDHRKAYMILAEFISESATYQKRLDEFFDDYYKVDFI